MYQNFVSNQTYTIHVDYLRSESFLSQNFTEIFDVTSSSSSWVVHFFFGFRRTQISFLHPQLMICLFFLEVIGFIRYASADTVSNRFLDSSTYRAPDNMIFRYAIIVMVSAITCESWWYLLYFFIGNAILWGQTWKIEKWTRMNRSMKLHFRFNMNRSWCLIPSAWRASHSSWSKTMNRITHFVLEFFYFSDV